MDLSNLSLNELTALAASLKEQIKETKAREQNELADMARGLGIVITDKVVVRMAGGDTAEGIVSKVTDKGVSVKIEGRDRALFRAWHLVDSLLEKGEGEKPALVGGDFSMSDIAEGQTVNFILKGSLMTGTVKRVGEKSWTASFFDETTQKVRNLSRPYNTIVSVATDADESLDELAV